MSEHDTPTGGVALWIDGVPPPGPTSWRFTSPSPQRPGHDRPRRDKICDVIDETLEPDASHDDVSLLQLIAGGDRAAFKAFYQRHAGRILGHLRQMCQDPTLSEDLLQEVFLQVWRKAATYRAERGDPMGWLFSVTRNKTIDHRRRHPFKLEGEERDLTAWPAPTKGHRDLRISLEQAMSRLSEDQQRALRMTYYGGYTYEEAADRLQVPLGTLKSRIRTGLQRLRTAFESVLCLML